METRVHCAKISSGNSVCLYEMVLENVLPEKCLFQYFVTEMTALS